MENTQGLLFRDEVPQWFVVVNDKESIGPLKASEVYAKVQSREITALHFVWKEGLRDPLRICDVPDLQPDRPERPSAQWVSMMKERLKPNPKPAPKPKVVPATKRVAPPPPPSESDEPSVQWFLFYNDTQFGPFTVAEIVRQIEAKALQGRIHAWHEGIPNWKRLHDLPEFSKWFESGVRAEISADDTDKKDKRGTPRRPLIARVILANDETVVSGLCRDISVGGMQVLTDRIPGPVGKRLKLNVTPPDQKQVAPFVAEGEIVRVLEDKKGFSFRFLKIPESAKKEIEKYLASGQS